MSESVIYAASWLVNPGEPPVAGGALLVERGAVVATGTLAELRSQYKAELIEYPGCAILPGFINAHSHLELTHFPAWRLRTNVAYNPRGFTDWIIQLIKIARGLAADDFSASLKEGIRLCLDSGTTAVGEILSNPLHAPLLVKSPLAGRLYFEVLGQETARFNEKLASALAAAAAPGSAYLQKGLSPHTLYTIGVQHLPAIRAAAETANLALAIHISESAAETDFIFNSSGPLATDFYPFAGWEQYLGHPLRCSSTELLDRHGLLGSNTLAVHCVHVTLSDARVLKERGASIALCPRSNDRLDVGVAPVALFKKLGIPLALGSDSLASNDSLSLWDEMRFAQQIYQEELSAAELLNMATVGGACALGLSERCGTLAAGKRADFQVVENCGDSENRLIERLVGRSNLREVYCGGVRYTGSRG